ncbi:peptidylprolyl isomerase [Stappia sp. F7233]|uniref:Peptidyl-prolyl cis-trans isomerase n=1 Tax=Stappia albiluteola TaxID=2758565 RepID=A0A839AGT9_9HYPH|nr:peptidylprolyl isomerase [Stappia albiluteola]MBA5778306.1 peptidylprolyl isomerase [Stappia albiluteola]
MTMAKQGDIVRIHYTGRFDDGTEFDSSVGRSPLEFTLGAGEIIPGLEREIDGMAVGARKNVMISAEDAYGPHIAEHVQEVDRNLLPPEIVPTIGTRLQAESGDGRTVVFTITAADETTVTLDANHPLAGKDLVFEVELIEIATAA